MFSITVQNVTGSRKASFSADSLQAAKKLASDILRNGDVHYSSATVSGPGAIHTGAVSVGGHRMVWTTLRY